ncbi:sulfatase-like hydrolase/transferase [Ramlibacter solisilvae]|uniref:Twin-arginine translocation pathway signal protein n=1 Tax=Ramlibacter tataouinensis TaxID=94132 RepID=A0A127JVX4_9BURK|nr:sulfatase-like hydrolase/transferase [Ramlibacter tataouinensis]AMO22172.1 twin-arginine translocation pathway signal protein [Ramlibacter tataouinensis]
MNRPNIIFIVADDLGFADLGCYGGRPAQFGPVSPVLDALAANGLKFLQGYANSPVCSPTRFALMTGRYQYRLRGAAEEPINSKSRGSATLGLPPQHPTLPSLLKESGWRTALIGKWHLGWPPHFGPLRSGYEEFFGPMSGGVDYFTHCDWTGSHDLWCGDGEHREEGYLTDLISRRAVDYIDRVAACPDPFFLSLHYTAPHWPWEARTDRSVAGEVKDNLFHLHGGNIETYRRMIHHMDEGIGWVMDALRRHGIDRRTLVVFTSDNGGERFSDNWPLVGGKMDLTEGGIRVPWIAHWPEVIAPGCVTGQQCMTMDWSATMLDAAGVTPHPAWPLDGVSLLPVLREPARSFRRVLHWRMNHRGQRALRDGDWKYLRVDGHDYLFDLAADERERANLAARQSARLADMREAWEAWNATMPPVPGDATISLGYGAKDMPQR